MDYLVGMLVSYSKLLTHVASHAPELKDLLNNYVAWFVEFFTTEHDLVNVFKQSRLR
jgi:hypothetical protein